MKAWEVCGYKTQKHLKADVEDMGAVTVWSPESLGAVMERVVGKDASTHFCMMLNICLSPYVSGR